MDNAIKDALVMYINEDHSYPDMKVFAATHGFRPIEVAEVIRNEDLGISKPQKELLLDSFVKREMVPQEPVVVQKMSNKEWARIHRKELREMFFSFEGSVEAFLEANPSIPLLQLKNVLSKEEYVERCEKKPRKRHTPQEFEELAKVFLGLEKTVDEFCDEQKIDLITFKKYIPKDVWFERKVGAKRRIDWPFEIAEMEKSGKSLEEWAHERNLSVTLFKERAGADVVRRCDNNGRMAERFNPELKLEINAQLLRCSVGFLERWVESKLKDLNPAKYKRFKMDEKDIRIEKLCAEKEEMQKKIDNLKQEIGHLERILANKNSYIEQMKTTQAQKAAKVSAAKKTLEGLLKEL